MASQEQKAGMCLDVEGEVSMAQLLVWLRRWREGELPRDAYAGGGANLDGPRVVYRWAEAWWLEQLEDEVSDDLHYGGGRRASKKTPSEVAALVGEQTVQLLGRAVRPFDGQVGGLVEDWLEDHMTGDKAAATERAYRCVGSTMPAARGGSQSSSPRRVTRWRTRTGC